MFDFSRSVSNAPGSRKLIVTFEAATERATPARKAVRPRARPEERSRPGQRHLHRARGDVDDAAEFLADHRVDRLLRELDRHHHVGDDAVDHLLARELAEIAERRPGIVVDQDVGLRAGGEQRRLAFRRRDVGRDGGDLGAGRLAQLGRNGFEPLAIAAVDDHLAAGFRQRLRAGAPSPRLEAQTMALRPAIPRSMQASPPATVP